jgi:hypothetical protein
MRFRIANMDGLGANLRVEPSLTIAPIHTLPEGAEVAGDEHAWRQVGDATGAQGWLAEERSTKHHADPMSVLEEKRREPHVWGP